MHKKFPLPSSMVHLPFNSPLTYSNRIGYIASDAISVDSNYKDFPFDLFFIIKRVNDDPLAHFDTATITCQKTINEDTITTINSSDLSGSFSTPQVFVGIFDPNGFNSLVSYDVSGSTLSNPNVTIANFLNSNLLDINPYMSLGNTDGINSSKTTSENRSYCKLFNNNDYEGFAITSFVHSQLLCTLTSCDLNVEGDEAIDPDYNSGYSLSKTYTIYPSYNYLSNLPASVTVTKPALDLRFKLCSGTINITDGLDYRVGDTFTVTGGTTDGVLTVSSVGYNGSIQSIDVTDTGSGFTNTPSISDTSSTGYGAKIVVNDNYAIDTVNVLSSGFPYIDGISGVIKEDLDIEPLTDSTHSNINYHTDNPGVFPLINRDKFSIQSLYVSNSGSGYDSGYEVKSYNYTNSGVIDTTSLYSSYFTADQEAVSTSRPPNLLTSDETFVRNS